jgi:predicted CoA-substrate-specific enzyme activase
MKAHVMGIDFGSTTAKTVILDLKGRIASSCVAHMGAVSGQGVKASISGALEAAGLTQGDMGFTVSTGYGRRMLDEADKNYTEITCHARGAAAMVPGARLVIDIGGQDSKVISLDASGLVSQFAMNDRCAAGTGKFLEVLARAMEIDLNDMGGVALQAQDELKISSMCATFAETEVISLLAEGKTKADVLGAVHAAIASRTVGLVGRVGKKGPIVMTGGVARNPAAVAYIERALGMPLVLPDTPQIAGALGAALIGLDEYRSEHKAELSVFDDEALEQQMNGGHACAPNCNGHGVAVEAPSVRTITLPESAKSQKQDLWDRIQSHL